MFSTTCKTALRPPTALLSKVGAPSSSTTSIISSSSSSRLPLPTASSSSSSRHLSASTRALSDGDGQESPFSRPGPPPLPPKEQREFERLVKEKSNALQFNSNASGNESDAIHPDARRVPTPDFEGDTNPSTGEVGGPKKDPLAWQREWTYGGRATDF
ncbi:hypothetical protein IE81DRAFT_327238 [Ceraceosorus guamensis]|uniref:Succinate dehydrogenase assembly factor 4, mitochondrial n=1 Tax=Ceraceosorus guamensis TaxID=1522189 RepID=A0A316VM84_9BASI|nr:hypothetical protein IE81DRAFT_327238 [Ceraceosorus guamensis]PWN38692.1 hypothetical protein IE81DRAFT_327238 [Ceraceosorus guamensis]